ncbi:hypothetical protein [Lactiplantibacillus pentosus]|jgi:hypothetical protein|uniref:hypothetical protein n=1 Tax=Lactiplantibacillus pentosus TaxID=1589 RepID=UPI0021A782E0|nr:hypothetical protein [Lactiplantibacillus pentosus]MCT3287010.1 hypothetical protein [Lactiplantibacillus pentosus]
MQNDLITFSQSTDSVQETQSVFKDFKTSAAVVVTVMVLSTSSQITSVFHNTDDSGVNVESTSGNSDTQFFYDEDLSDSKVKFLESMTTIKDEYKVINEMKQIEDNGYISLMRYVHFIDAIGIAIGIVLLIAGFVWFGLPLLVSVLLSLGGFILPILVRISGVYKYARK